MKYCSKCGKQLLNEVVICPSCGCSAVNPNQPAKANGGQAAVPKSAKASMIFGIPAIVCANKSKRETNGKFCFPAKLGLIFGIIGLCWWGLGILIYFSQL